MRRFSVLVPIALALAASPARAEEARAAAPKRVCLPASETREEIKKSRLREPFAVLKLAAQHFKAEALSAKLCRIDDEFIYEVVLLHRDGKFFHGHVNATTGKIVDMRRGSSPPPKTTAADH